MFLDNFMMNVGEKPYEYDEHKSKLSIFIKKNINSFEHHASENVEINFQAQVNAYQVDMLKWQYNSSSSLDTTRLASNYDSQSIIAWHRRIQSFETRKNNNYSRDGFNMSTTNNFWIFWMTRTIPIWEMLCSSWLSLFRTSIFAIVLMEKKSFYSDEYQAYANQRSLYRIKIRQTNERI